MRPPRATIGGLMALVVVVALACEAVREPSAWLASLTFALALGVLATAILGALFRRGARRAYWVGFALFGWGYLLLSLGPWCQEEVEPHLPTTRLIGELHRHFRPREDRPEPVDRWINEYHGRVTAGWGYHWERGRAYFYRIGHSLAALTVAGLGGAIGRRFAETAARPVPRPRPGGDPDRGG